MSENIKKSWLFLGTLLLAGGMYVGILNAYITNQATLATNPSANALFVPVRNADTVTHEVGDVVVWSDNTNDGVDITTTIVTNDGLVAGVIAINDIPSGEFGLVQVAGYHSALTVTGTPGAGESLVTSATGESGAEYTISQATGSNGDGGGANGINEATINGVYAVCLTTAAASVCQGIVRAL